MPKHVTISAETYDQLFRSYELQDIEEWIDNCYAAGANAHDAVKFHGPLELTLEIGDDGEVIHHANPSY